jgi:3-hydroxybutyryl-CoA dehydratase
MADFDDMRVGDYSERIVSISPELVESFARLTGDMNPLHMDEAYASKTFFRKRVAHGMLPASFIGAILGTALPGPGTIYLYQNLSFKAPVYIGDAITVRAEIIRKDAASGSIFLRTSIKNGKNVLVLEGEAGILFRPAKE